MTITVRSNATAGGSSGGDVTISKPTGTVDNDIMIAFLYTESGASAWTLPSGWAWLAQNQQDYGGNYWNSVAWKRASSEGSNYTFTHSPSGWRDVVIVSWSGATTSGDPQDSTAVGKGASGTTVSSDSITNATANSMNQVSAQDYSGTNLGTASSGYTDYLNFDDVNVFYYLQASSGASGAKTFSAGDINEWSTWHFSIAEDTGGTNLTVAALSHTNTLDAGVLVQNHNPSVNALSHTNTLDAAVLAQLHNISVQAISHTNALDNATITKVVQLVVDALSHTNTLDAAQLAQIHNIVMQALSHTDALDGATLNQIHNLAVAALSHTNALDNAVLVVNGAGNLIPSALSHTNALDGITLAQTHNLQVAALAHTNTLDSGVVNQNIQLVAADISHTNTLDGATVSVAHLLILAALNHGNALDAAVLSVAHTLSMNDMSHTNTLDNGILTVGEFVTNSDNVLYLYFRDKRAYVYFNDKRAYVPFRDKRAVVE